MRPQDMAVNLPTKGLTRRKQSRKPLGIVMVLGGLFLMGTISYFTTPEREKWVMTDFKTSQGVYMGNYLHRGKWYITIQSDSGIESIQLDEGVIFKQTIPVGSRVSVTYQATDARYPKIVRGEDIRNIYVPDSFAPGESTRF